MKEYIIRELTESASLHRLIADKLTDVIATATGMIITAYRNGGKLMLAGNGGSAADSEHIAAELVGRFKKERAALPAVALTANTPVLTALANDYTYARVFARQIEALGKSGDVLMLITTSGNSINLIEAVVAAKNLGIVTIGLLGNEGGRLKKMVDASIVIPSANTPRIQEAQMTVGHIICGLVEKGIGNESGGIS